MRKLSADVARIAAPDAGGGRRRSRHGRRRHSHLWARWRFVGATSLVLATLAASTILLERHRNALAARLAAVPVAIADTGRVEPVAAGKPERRIYPYSVINGGAHSADELKAAMAADPVVANDYEGFDLERTRLAHLDRPRLAYVSYRIGDRVYRTRKRLLVPAGEPVLTDGARVARTRCGNQLSDAPGETSVDEPPPGMMDVPLGGPLSLRPSPLPGPGGVNLPPGGADSPPSGPIATAAPGPVGTPGAPVGTVPSGGVPVPGGPADPSGPAGTTADDAPLPPSSPTAPAPPPPVHPAPPPSSELPPDADPDRPAPTGPSPIPSVPTPPLAVPAPVTPDPPGPDDPSLDNPFPADPSPDDPGRNNPPPDDPPQGGPPTDDPPPMKTVPEPGTMVLLMVAAGLLGARELKRRAQS